MTDCKIVVFGSGAVGKSCLTIQFIQGLFCTIYDPTIEEAYRRNFLINGTTYSLNILDTAGQDDFAPMRTAYTRSGNCFIICYSIDDRSSFEQVEDFYRLITRTKGTTDIPLVLVATKSDLAERRVVTQSEGEDLAKDLNAAFLETSAKERINVEKTFELAVLEMAKRNLVVKPEPVKKVKKAHKLHLKCHHV